MPLPAPNLDDRHFQELVDEAKRMVQRQWPDWTAWTDHNVSDPGVTLIETFAYMVDQLIYRLNRVPDRNYVKFLELIGVELRAPAAAVADVTFRLTAPQPDTVRVPIGTEVGAERTDDREPVVFRVRDNLDIVHTHLVAVGVERMRGGGYLDLSDQLSAGGEIALFSDTPQPGDCFYVGLSVAAPSCLVALRFNGPIEGYGINPDRPPRRWEAFTGDRAMPWVPCEVEKDETGGFNRVGDVWLHIPGGHRAAGLAQRDQQARIAGWLRCVVTTPDPGENPYAGSPHIDALEAFTLGATVQAEHSTEVRDETLGVSEGVAGQQYTLRLAPVVRSTHPVEIHAVIAGNDTTAGRIDVYRQVDSFAGCDADDAVFTLDAMTATVRFAPMVRLPNGSARAYGAIPPAGALLRVPSYRSGGGQAGNVGPYRLVQMRESLPFVASVANRRGAGGGVDGETVDEAKVRGPLELRSRDRAVTAEDHEQLALAASRAVARAKAVDDFANQAGQVRVLLVPAAIDGPDGRWRLQREQLTPTPEVAQRVVSFLDERRIVGTRIVVSRADYQGVTVQARVRVRRTSNGEAVRAACLDALYRYFHPVVGGPEGHGWPFGRPVQAGEVYAVLGRVDGVDFVEGAILRPFDVDAGVWAPTPAQRIDLGPGALVYSHQHTVDVVLDPGTGS